MRLRPLRLPPLAAAPRYFNPVQSECYLTAYESSANMVVSAPTGSGKTGVMELALLRLLRTHLDAAGLRIVSARGAAKAVYIAPMRAIVQEVGEMGVPSGSGRARCA